MGSSYEEALQGHLLKSYTETLINIYASQILQDTNIPQPCGIFFSISNNPPKWRHTAEKQAKKIWTRLHVLKEMNIQTLPIKILQM